MGPGLDAAYWVSSRSPQTAQAAAYCAIRAVPAADAHVERQAQARLVREIFGNPFRSSSATVQKIVCNDEVTKIARAIYEGGLFDSENFDDLADALDRAGAGGEMADHCRNMHEHIRGCWVQDVTLNLLDKIFTQHPLLEQEIVDHLSA